MGVRLLGACLAWQAGWGIEGVVGTIALSIATGWAVLRTSLPAIDQVGEALLPVVQMLFIAAGPFAVLQLAQVAALDGDIFLAKAGLPAEEAGYIGALSLFQRIAFFACFALASVLLPGVVSAARDGGSVIRAAAPVGLLWLCVTLPFLAAIHAAPDQLVTLLVGTEFLSAAPGLMAAGISAVAFTLSYLLATFLAALNDRRGIWAVALMSFLQLALMYVTLCDPTTDVISLVTVKAGCQSLLAVAMCVYTLSRLRRRIGI
jgi:O-antigen/teichoic acid export membrane protein